MTVYSLLQSSVPAVLFGGACAGHIALVIRAYNRYFSAHLTSGAAALLALGHGAAIVAGPLLLWSVYGPGALSAQGPAELTFWQAVLAPYLLVCWAVAFGALPAVTLRRWLRRPPDVQRCARTRTVDIAAELGHKPVGQGRHCFLAHLPGNEIFQVDFTERALCLPGLPSAWDGLSVLHLSDLHLCGTPDRPFYEEVLERCAGWEADLVALTGDVVDGPEYRDWIAPLLGRLRWRVAGLAILGNHDCWHEPPLIREQLARAGLRVLDNSWEQLIVRGEPLAVIGHEGPWFRPEPDLTDCPQDVFRLCLSHTPDNVFWGRRHGVDLMLAGHNHGGQVRLPLLGSVLVPSRYGRRFDCGLCAAGPTVLHVSRGLGGSHPLRYNCRPEVTRLVLRCDKMAAAWPRPRRVRPQAVGAGSV
jgi:predicted MPP superfamily phosphohydrolase